jgi:hypothetical protein
MLTGVWQVHYVFRRVAIASYRDSVVRVVLNTFTKGSLDAKPFSS